MSTKFFFIALFCVFLFALPHLIRGQETVTASPSDANKVEADLRADSVGAKTDDYHEDSLVKEALEKGEKFQFQTEVNRLLGLIINSLYTNKDIFLRELISNASDALDKIRFISLTDKNALSADDNMEIKIKTDKKRNILTITDSGIGMTKNDLINNLGTIAKSGTKNFIEKVKETGDMNLIGQFGVGFYSAFLVADAVTVASKHNDDDQQWIWESAADNTFSIVPDPRGNTIKRGTEINLYLKDDAKEYLEPAKLKELIQKYSEFIHFPISVYVTKEVEKEVPIEEETTTTEEEKKPEAVVEGEEKVEVTEDKKETPKTKKVKETVSEWEVINENKPIWIREPKEVSEEEYEKFYKSFTKEHDAPIAHTHFQAEGDVDFKSILFVPGHAPYNLFETASGKTQASIKLYVRRVFITDELPDFIPRYLNFIKGIVDSDDLPLNVSREILQQSRLLKLIKKRLVKKMLQLLKQLSDKDIKARLKSKKAAADEEEEKEEKEESQDEKKEAEKYEKVWKEFGKNLRLGIIEDSENRALLAKLLRFHSTKSEDKLISLEEYVARMKEGQKDIYFISGESLEAVKQSPFLDELKRRDFEVLYFVDAIDEYIGQHLPEFEKKKIVSVSREGLKFGDEGEDEKQKETQYEVLTKWLSKTLGEKISKAIVSHRLKSAPVILSSPQHGLSANMYRILSAQALGDNNMLKFQKVQKIMEINPDHQIIGDLLSRIEANENDQKAKDIANLLYETALLQSGFSIDNTADFAERIHRLLQSAGSVSSSSSSASSSSSSSHESETKSAETKDEL